MKVASLFIEEMLDLNPDEICVLESFEIRNQILDSWLYY